MKNSLGQWTKRKLRNNIRPEISFHEISGQLDIALSFFIKYAGHFIPDNLLGVRSRSEHWRRFLASLALILLLWQNSRPYDKTRGAAYGTL